MAAISATDVWAVGYYRTKPSTPLRTLTEHYNGTKWSVVSSRSVGTDDHLTAASAISASDVWAVGYYLDAGGDWRTLVERYDGTTWRVVSSPNVGAHGSFLSGVAAVSASNVWAVGTGRGDSRTLVEHYDGTKWSVVSSPKFRRYFYSLSAVAAISATNVWAVGDYDTPKSNRTLVEHYNGTKWSVVSSPSPGARDYNFVNGMTAISATNVWLVGTRGGGSGPNRTLIEHFNGRRRSTVSSPYESTRVLSTVSAISQNDAWAVGYYFTSTGVRTLIEHYDGTKWKVVSSPNPSTGGDNFLNGVAAISASDVWAVGEYVFGAGRATEPLIEHYDGSKWRVVSSPKVGTADELNGVAAISASNVWAVGQSNLAGARTLIEHYNGSTWKVISSPNPVTGGDNILNAVAAISASDVWAVGQSNLAGARTLIEHYNGTRWSVVSTPNPDTRGYDFLNGVAATSGTDVWAVGTQGGSGPNRTLVVHYNGTRWSVVYSPSRNVGVFGGGLTGVAAASDTNVWAVGSGMIEHYNGTGWRVISSPNGGTGDNLLNALAAVSGPDAWGVGYYYAFSGVRTLIQHYNGTKWSVVPSP